MPGMSVPGFGALSAQPTYDAGISRTGGVASGLAIPLKPKVGTYQTWTNPETGAVSTGDPNDTGFADRMQQQWQFQQKSALASRLLSSIGSAGSGGGSVSYSSSAGGGGAVGPTQISLPNSQASDAAAMTRQKEESGQALAGAAKTLRGVYNSRGLTGSGQETLGEQKLVSDAERSQTATGADLLRQSLDRTSQVNSENAQLQEGYANRQTNYNISQQQIALNAKIAAQNQLTDLLRTVGALV